MRVQILFHMTVHFELVQSDSSIHARKTTYYFSAWYQHAKSGFKYWDGTKDKYKPSDPVKTRFSMGERFNPGKVPKHFKHAFLVSNHLICKNQITRNFRFIVRINTVKNKIYY